MWVPSIAGFMVRLTLLQMVVAITWAGPETSTPTPITPSPITTSVGQARSQLRQVLQAESKSRPTPSPVRPPLPAPSVSASTPVPRPRLATGWDIPSPVPSPEPEPTPERPEEVATDVVVMAPIAVVEKKDTELRARIRDKEEERIHLLRSIERIEDSVLDKILNSPVVAIFGGASTENRIREIEARISSLEQEIHLLKAFDQATTLQERESIGRSLRELYNPPRGKP